MQTPPVCDYEGSDYQATFWDQGGRAYEDRAEGIALRRLLPPGGKRLLELGAGAGRNTPRYTGFEQITLLDYSRSQLKLARQRLGEAAPDGTRYRYVAADIYRLPFAPGLFDAATMIRTLHHMADAPLALSQVRQALQPGAVFILEYASKQNLKAILRYALGRQAWSPFTPDPVEFVRLNFDFHPAAIRAWLKQAGFGVQRQITVSHFRIGLLKRLFPAGLLAWLDSLAQHTGDWWQFTPSVFVRAAADAQGAPAGADEFFRCPQCRHMPLNEVPTGFACPACGRSWAIHDGIYDFRQPVNG